MSRRKSRRPPRGPGHDGNDDLLAVVDRALAEQHPMPLLGFASSLLTASARDDGPDLPRLVEMFLESDEPRARILAWVIAQLSPDELLRRRATRAVPERELPDWLREVAHPSVMAACQTRDVLRDGSNVVLGLRFGACDLTLVGFIDHNLNGALTDGYTITEDVDSFLAVWNDVAGEQDIEVLRISTADARARLEAAIARGDEIRLPDASESWPAMRPLLEWALRLCPAGGRDFERQQFGPAERQAVIADFISTPHGRPYADPEEREVLDEILQFGAEHGWGDPLLLSPRKVELLLDLGARAFADDDEALAEFCHLLIAFIPYAHQRRRISRDDTSQTLQQVLQLSAQLLDEPTDPWADLRPKTLHEALVLQVGDEQTLAAVTDAPLPAEELDLSGVDADVHERVRAVGALTDDCCEALFDAECRTATRRFLRDIALGDPSIFRRRGRDETAAAAVCWLVCRANTVMRAYGGVQSKELMAHFGLTGSASQRAEPMRVAIGLPRWSPRVDLGTPRYLTGDTRREIIRRRDHPGPYESWL